MTITFPDGTSLDDLGGGWSGLAESNLDMNGYELQGVATIRAKGGSNMTFVVDSTRTFVFQR